MYKYEEDLFHFGAKKGILGNRAGKVAPNRKSRRQGRPKSEIAPATPAATFKYCTGALARRCYTILPCFPFYFPQHLFYQLIDI